MSSSGITYNPTKRPDGFDWDTFWNFTSRHTTFNRLLYAVHFRHYRRLLDGVLPPDACILELGAGSGVIARRIVSRWGGHATLVDSNEKARSIFLSAHVPGEELEYILGDVLKLSFPPLFDLVYSDGLIEHFPDKKEIMAAHLRALKPSGHLILFVPSNSMTFRTITRFGPDMGYEERYTMTALIGLCRDYGLEVLRTTSYFFELGVLCRRPSRA
jgi:ubiquinone/menaquinone biosynthesis C-methylase UbiE